MPRQENLLNVSDSGFLMVGFDYLKISGKDIEIALTEIGELQNHINSLVKDEDEKETIIENLRKKRDQLQR